MNSYELVTKKIIDRLEDNVIPWKLPWKDVSAPKNLKSGKEYQGINSILLHSAGYPSAYWVTFKQAKEQGGRINKGENGMPVIYWQWVSKNGNGHGENGDSGKAATSSDRIDQPYPLLKHYTVFNIAQTHGIEEPGTQESNIFNPIEKCEQTIAQMPNQPNICGREQRAYYRPLEDLVNMPKAENFKSDESYYSTLFHELCHSTGHESRLNRNSLYEFGDTKRYQYAGEELVAEMGSAFLCSQTGIEPSTIDDSVSYIQNWLNVFRQDKKLLIYAASQGQKAAEYITGKRPGAYQGK